MFLLRRLTFSVIGFRMRKSKRPSNINDFSTEVVVNLTGEIALPHAVRGYIFYQAVSAADT